MQHELDKLLLDLAIAELELDLQLYGNNDLKKHQLKQYIKTLTVTINHLMEVLSNLPNVSGQ